MFERTFQRTMALAARLLFAAALVMFVWGLVYFAHLLIERAGGEPSGSYALGWDELIMMVLATTFRPAVELLFCAAVVHHLERWLKDRQGT